MCVAVENMKKKALEEGIEEGKREGRIEGMKEGRIEGMKEGMKEGIKEGRIEGQKETAINLYHMGMKEDFIAKAVNVSIDLVKQWLNLATL